MTTVLPARADPASPPGRLQAPAAPPAARPPAATRPAAGGPPTTDFLAFKLGGEEYGIDILRVQEIRSFEKPTRIANAPEHILGVLNLRGLIVPIVDLRLKFGFRPADDGDFTVTIVLAIGTKVVGIVVDAVSDVIALTPEQLRPVPELHASVQSDHLLAIGAVERRMLMLVDIDVLMNSPSMGLARALASSTLQ